MHPLTLDLVRPPLRQTPGADRVVLQLLSAPAILIAATPELTFDICE
jgi:hypothetical protein